MAIRSGLGKSLASRRVLATIIMFQYLNTENMAFTVRNVHVPWQLGSLSKMAFPKFDSCGIVFVDLKDGEGDGNIVFPPKPPFCTHHVGRGFIYSWAGLRRGLPKSRR